MEVYRRNTTVAHLVAMCPLAVGILVNFATCDLEMVRLDSGGLSIQELDRLQAEWAPRRLEFAGVAGLAPDGSPRCALEEPLEPNQVNALVAAFVAYSSALIIPAVERQRARGAVDWLEALFALPDDRD